MTAVEQALEPMRTGETALDAMMSTARQAASERKRTLQDYIYFLGDAADRIEGMQERLVKDGLRGAPDADEMFRAQVLKNAALRFAFELEHGDDFADLLRRLAFGAWRKTRPLW